VQIYNLLLNGKTFCLFYFQNSVFVSLLYPHLPMKNNVDKHFVKYFKNIFLYLRHESKKEITTVNLSIRYDYKKKAINDNGA